MGKCCDHSPWHHSSSFNKTLVQLIQNYIFMKLMLRFTQFALAVWIWTTSWCCSFPGSMMLIHCLNMVYKLYNLTWHPFQTVGHRSYIWPLVLWATSHVAEDLLHSWSAPRHCCIWESDIPRHTTASHPEKKKKKKNPLVLVPVSSVQNFGCPRKKALSETRTPVKETPQPPMWVHMV